LKRKVFFLSFIIFMILYPFSQKIKYSFIFDTFSLNERGDKEEFLDSIYVFLGENIWVEKYENFRLILNVYDRTLYFVDDANKTFSGGNVDEFFKEMKAFYDKFLRGTSQNYKIEKEDLGFLGKITSKFLKENGKYEEFEIDSGGKKIFLIRIDKRIGLNKLFKSDDFGKCVITFFNISSMVEKRFFTRRRYDFEKKLNEVLFEIYRVGFPVRIVEYKNDLPHFLTEVTRIEYAEKGRVANIDLNYKRISFAQFEKNFFN